MLYKNQDNQLVKEVKAGDAAAFAELIKKYNYKITKIISRYIKDHDEILDVKQEIFIKTYLSLPEFREESSFFTWLYRIAINTAKNNLLNKSKELRIYNENPDYFNFMQNNLTYGLDDNPEHEILSKELEEAIFSTIEDMPLDLKEVIALREFSGLHYKEIANLADCPIGTVRSRISRARGIIDNKIKYFLQNK